MKIRILPYSDLYKREVLLISDKQIGKDFINEKYLGFFLNNPDAKGFVAVSDGNVVGFSFFLWCAKEEISKYIFTEKAWLNDVFRNTGLIGYRSLLAVKKEFQNKGVGSRIIDFSMQELKKKTNSIAGVVWKNHLTFNHGTHLQKHGLKSIRIVPFYWKEDSLKRNYECAVCGPPPCLCSAEIYVLSGVD